MMRTFRAELLKLLTTKSWWIMGICIVAITSSFSAIMAFTFHLAEETTLYATAETQAIIWTIGQQTARVLVLVMGVLLICGEYRHKTLASTYLGTPNRYLVIVMKMLVTMLLGASYGFLSNVGAVLAAAPFISMHNFDPHLMSAYTWKMHGLCALIMALWALMGMAFGILIRNMIAAVVIAIGFAYVVEPILNFAMLFLSLRYPDNGLWSVIQNLMPSAASMSVLGVDNPLGGAAADPFPWWGSLLVMAGWTVVPTALGAIFTVRRDVD